MIFASQCPSPWPALERLEVGGEALALHAQLLGLLGVDVVEHVERLRVRQRLAALAQVVAELVGLLLDAGDEVVVDQAVAAQVDLEPRDRVLELPVLDVVVEPVAGRVVGRGVGTHPVGVGLDERRALAVAGALQRGLRDDVRREDVVAVDADAGEAEAERALVERDPRLALDRLGDRPLVVLAEEHDRGVVGRGEDERLVDVALAGGAVAEVGDHGRVAVGVAGADGAVALDAHRVAGGVQRLRADHDRVEAEVVLVRVPAAVVDPAEQAEQVERVDALAVGDAVLAVGREDEVLRAQRAAGADLGGLLAEQLGPDAELAVALEGGGLGVDPPGEHHVAVEAAQLLGGEVEVELRVVDAFALGRQQLDQLGAAVAAGKVRRPRPGRGRILQWSPALLLASTALAGSPLWPLPGVVAPLVTGDTTCAPRYRRGAARRQPRGGSPSNRSTPLTALPGSRPTRCAPLSLWAGTSGPAWSSHQPPRGTTVSTHVTTHNPVRSDLTTDAADHRPGPHVPARRSGSRLWAVAGIGAGVCGIGTVVSSGMVNAIYDPALVGDPAGITARLVEQVPTMYAFHTFTTLGAVLLVVFAAGLHRRLRAVLPDSVLPTVALAGLIGTAFVSIMGSGLDTEFMMGIPIEDAVQDANAAMFNHWIGTIPWLWTLAGLSGLALFAAHRRGGVPRWIGRVGLVLGGLTLLLGVSPLQYMAGMTGPLWLLVTAIGFVVGDRAYRAS